MAEAIAKALEGVCGGHGFDETTLEYMASLIEDGSPESPQDLWELIGDFLQDADIAEAKGLAMCGDIMERWKPGVGQAAKPKAKAPEPAAKPGGTKLTTPFKLSSVIGDEAGGGGGEFGAAYQIGGGYPGKAAMDEMPTDTLKVVAQVAKAKKEKQARRAERKAWRAEEKGDDASVWVDLPAGASIGTGGSTSVDFHIDKFSLPNKRGSGDLLTDVNVTFAQGRRYGLIGRNGVGKSTLLDAIARREVPGVPSCSIFYVRQEVEGDDRTALDWVLQADSERSLLEVEKAKLEAEKDKPEAGLRLAQVYQKLEELGGESEHVRQSRAMTIMTGLGFTEAMRGTATQSLSGGWRMRTALACALFVSPGMLLLDEPTNHLDLETVLWLERYLNEEFHATVLVVSHDRVFLNEVVTDIVLFENSKLEVYKGSYETFEKIREEHRLRQERLREAQEMKREHLQEYITKHAEAGSNGCKAAAQRKARIKKLERLGMEAQAAVDGRKLKLSYDGVQEDVEAVAQAAQVVMQFPDPGVCDSLGNALLRFEDVEFGYNDLPALFSGVTFSVYQSSRVALLGKNGTGKSTLIKLLIDRLKPRSGLLTPNRGTKVQYIAQHHLDELDGEARPLQLALERFPGDGSNTHELKMRQHLGHFGLGGDVLPNQLIRTLSGGQKFRVSLALAMYSKPHLLVMDEPTNHLDLETIDALITAVNDFQGGVVIVSHDEHLIGSICKDLYVFDKKKVQKFKGTIAEYKAKVLKASA